MELSNKKNLLSNNSFFLGSSESFHKFIGGYARNKIQAMTKPYKRKIGKCQHCGLSQSELKSKGINLHAAHIHGNERKDIIDNILDEFKFENLYKVELEKFESQFISSHNPIESIILILCEKCHTKYDNEK
jgi:hypothetical protein|tara:strand:+ start:379 stop:771 length:393 start_codon:yes stop_codon:yes gene_type:complete